MATPAGLRKWMNPAAWIVAAYPGWLAMEAVHETGHALHAIVSGGRVSNVEFPLLGFSRTDLSLNPHPTFVTWGGPVWGALLPLGMWVMVVAFTRSRQPLLRRVLQAFAGFCLIANGSYLGAGWYIGAGDAEDLLRRGTPPAAMIAFGVVATATGLWLWHRLDAQRRGPTASNVPSEQS